MRARSSTASTLPALTPMNTSAPSSASGSSPRRPARVGPPGQLQLGAGEPLVVGREDALAVPHQHLAGAGLQQQVHDRRAGRAAAGDDDLHVAELLVHDPQRVGQRGQRDDRRAVLVVVEDRDVELLAQPRLDLEAARRGDVLEVDAAEAGGDQLDGAHDLVDVLGVEADRPGVDVGEPLEQRRPCPP